jgi:hypothetical protein
MRLLGVWEAATIFPEPRHMFQKTGPAGPKRLEGVVEALDDD